jgi:hypothetical protein
MAAKPETSEATTPRPSTSEQRRWPWRVWGGLRSRRARLALTGVTTLVVFFTVVGPISFSNKNGSPPVLPDTEQQFFLNLQVVGSMQHDVIYAVEQRARPKYRIFAFDPKTGVDTTVFAVPKDAIVYGIALSPDRSTMAVSYSPDFHINGSGLSLLNLKTQKLSEITPATTGVFDVGLEWSSDASAVYSTHVDQSEPVEKLDIARTSIADRSVDIVIRNGAGPRFVGKTLYYLEVDSSHARRAIRRQSDASVIAVGDGSFDLDYLLRGADNATLRVGAISPKPQTSVTVGTPASAHGNHDVPSTWWSVGISGTTSANSIGLDPAIVYDAASRNASIVYATQEGLSIAVGTTKTDLIASRAIRLVAA